MEIQKNQFSSSVNELSANLVITGGKPRLLKAARFQIEMQWTALDELIDEDHPVRQIWAYVENLNLASHLNTIKSIEGTAGRSAIDPKILIALWLYATIENIGSARVLDRYTREHLAFKWICGGVPIARKTISDFRTSNGELFEELLAQGVAVLVKSGMTVVEEIAQDGLRVRASAGRGSFRREKTIKELYKQAKERLATLKKEIEEDPSGCISRQQAAKKQAAEAKLKRLKAAQQEFDAYIEQKESLRKKHKKKV
jgi:transposase